MPNPSGVPAFGGYVAVPSAHGNADLLAWWSDGAAAVWHVATEQWRPFPAPSFAALFPDRVTREPSGLDFMPVEIADAHAVTPLPFLSDLPAQPRPDDADPLEYPVTGRRDD